MAQPTPYTPAYSFTDHEAVKPDEPPPGSALDAEFAALMLTLQQIRANLAKIQRDDTRLANASVSLDTLDTAVLTMLEAGSGWSPRGLWVTATAYALGDLVTVGTATYVCSAAHNSDALFATDLAAGRWVLLFDTAGATPADNSVTSVKLANGAVQSQHIGFTSLDLTGTIRGQGGLRAGNATSAAAINAKAAAGDVLLRLERENNVTQAVGLEFIGPGATWAKKLAAGSNDLVLTYNGATKATFGATGGFDLAATIRATAGAVPTAGAGAGLNYVGGIGYLIARDYTANQWKDLKVQGKDVYVTAGGVDALKATSTYVDALVELRQNGVAVGFKGLPRDADNDAKTLHATNDNGGFTYSENTAGQTITLPPYAAGAAAGFAVDWVHVIINDGTSPITLQGGAGVNLRLVGTATVGASRTIAPGGWATIKCVKQNRYFVGGVGVS